MLEVPHMLMVGSTGRNRGKTELACQIIREHSQRVPIVGVKWTPISGPGVPCPRGVESCGVCASFKGEFCIDNETSAEGDKDTKKLLASGAEEVLWVRTLRSESSRAAEALLARVQKGSYIVCESNSLRKLIEPGAFVMVDRSGETTEKDSALKVMSYVDRVFESDGRQFNPPLDRIRPTPGGWSVKFPAAAVVLAGGRSSRMGRDKSQLEIDGRSLLESVHNQLEPHFEQSILSVGRESELALHGAETVRDSEPGQGPLMGIISALRNSKWDRNFVIACDIPRVNLRLVKRLLRAAERHDVTLPVDKNGRIEPLFAVYRTSALPAFERAFAQGARRIRDAFGSLKVRQYSIEEDDIPANLNTPEDYRAYMRELEKGAVRPL